MKPKYNISKIRNQTLGASLVTAISICFTSSAFAADVFWNGSTSNDWNTAANWTTGLPTVPDDAVVNNAGAFPTAVISANLTVNPRDIIVGRGSGNSGQLDLTAGNITTGGWTFIGRNTGSTGTFNMNAPGGSYTTGRLVVGEDGTGNLNFGGGTINSSAEVWIGQGGTGNGTMTMTAGTLNSSNWTVVGRAGATGTLNMSGGTITKSGGGEFIIGDNGPGTVIQTGGTINSGGNEYWVGQGSNSSIHTISSGNLNVGNWLAVGRNGGTGTLTQTGGTVTKTGGGDLVIGAGGGASTGTVNTSGGILSVNNQIQISENGSTAISTLNISGTAQVSAAAVQVGSGGATGTGNLNITGGTLTTGQILDGTGLSNATFDGGLIVPTGIQPAFITALDTATIGAGNLNLNTGTFAIGVPQLLGGTGGVTKTGSGTLTLTGANTYSGVTAVDAGKLIVSTTTANSGAVSVADSATFSVVQDTASGVVTRSSATFGSSGPTALDLNLGNFPGNPASAPLNVTGNIALNGNLTINVADADIVTGTIPLIQFASKSGPGSFALGTLPAGVSATLVVTATSVSLNVTSVKSLRWEGNFSGVWDINTTTNWYDLLTATPNVVYIDSSSVLFNDVGAITPNVVLNVAVLPALVTYDNTLSYTLSGTGGINGSTKLVKNGAGSVTVSTLNSYTGATTLNAGTLIADTISNGNTASSIGTAPSPAALTNNLVFGGGTLSYTGASTTTDRGFTTAGTGGGIDIANNLTMSGPVASVGGNFIKTGSGNLSLTNPGTNAIGGAGQNSQVNGGTLTLGPGTNNFTGQLWVGAAPNVSGNLVVNSGTLNVSSWLSVGRGNGDSGTISDITATNSTITCVNFSSGFDGGLATNLSTQNITLTNTALTNTGVTQLAESANSTTNLTIEGTSSYVTPNRFNAAYGLNSVCNILVKDTGSFTKTGGYMSIGQESNGVCTLTVQDSGTVTASGDFNIADVGTSTGTINIRNSALVKSTGIFFLGKNANTLGTANLEGGVLEVVRVRGGGGNGNFNFDGGVLRAGTGADANFMDLVTNVNVLAGGTIDSNGNNIATSQAFTGVGVGGITKIGAGTFTYNGFASYTGSTNVAAGTLAGNGTVSGPLDTLAGTILAPGNAVGTFNSGAATVRGSLAIELNGANGDRLSVTGQLDLTSATDSLDITVPGAGATKVAYVIASYTSLTGNFGALITGLPTGYSIDYNYLALDQIAIVRPVTPFDTFIGSFFPGVEDPAIVGPDADPDGDGNSNKLEFVLGGDPNSGSDGPKVYQLIADSSDGGTAPELLMTIAVLDGTPAFVGSPSPSATHSGFTYAVQGSFDLATFTSPVTAVAPVTTGLPAAPSGYNYRTFSLNGTNGTPDKGFLRVMINP